MTESRDTRLLGLSFLFMFISLCLFIAWCQYSDCALEIGAFIFG